MQSIQISFFEIIALIAVLHCFILSLLILLSKFFRSPNNKYLGYTLLIIAIVGINNWFWDRGQSPVIISVFDLFLWQFLYPVMLVLFFYKTSNHTSDKSKNIKFLYLPFIILSTCNVMLSLSTIFNLYSLPEIINNHITLFYKGVSFLSVIFPIYTIILSYKYILAQKDNLSEKWLKYLWAFFSLILLFGVVLESYRFIYSEKLPLTYLWTFGSIFIYWLIYHGMYQFKLSNDQFEIRVITNKKTNPITKSNITKSSYFKKLTTLIEEEKIHHNPNLSRDEVAEHLGISNGYLSQIIKENTDSGFSDFINSYRVKDVKKMIKDPMFDKYSLLAIGLECGFNSKTSFNANFKKETGLTPKEFKNK